MFAYTEIHGKMIIEGETPKYGRFLAKQMEAFMVDSSYLKEI